MTPPVLTSTLPFWAGLSAHGDRPALVTTSGLVTYAQLAERVAGLAAALGATRRLVVIEGSNSVETVVAYLAAVSGGHAAILVPSGDSVASYDADVVVREGSIDIRRDGSAHAIHPDLALLLSTSGSTGSPKLVRLSHKNLTSNAVAIASYLGIRPTDVAPTTLPMHYCYGLSVLNSHLSVGATVLLTDESVTSAGFWEAFRSAGCTTLAGVPYTFDLLDRVGFASMELPTLRYLTQAGGRLDPATVRRYAELGQQRGFDLFVMYGATEATARMAYLPPDLAAHCAGAVGVPIPGGSFTIDEGELVYRGDNVMLGYADSPADLARGAELSELRTGDLARLRPDGLVEITGRTSRFAKVFGLRLDLERVEQVLAADGCIVHCADGGERVVVAVDVSARPAPADLPARAAAAAGVPEAAVQVVPLHEVPRLPNGKPDYAAIVEASRRSPLVACEADAPLTDLTALYAEVLRCEVTPADSFVSLGGDSLSYVAMSLRLEAALGSLPADWPNLPIRELDRTTRRPRRGRSVETNVLLRAGAIVAVVGSHSQLFTLVGGAHVLLAIAGFNFARFFLTDASRRERVQRLLMAVLRLAVPSMLFFAAVVAFASDVTWRNVLLVNGVLSPDEWTTPWHYWFVEAVLYTMLAMVLLLSSRWFDDVERRWPFWTPVVLVLASLLTRYEIVTWRDSVSVYRAHILLWLFLLGWAAVKAGSNRERLVVTGLVLATVPGFFAEQRTIVIVAGLLLLVWVPSMRVPAVLVRPAGVLASASLYIYLAHWQVFPHLRGESAVIATIASLAAGLALWWVLDRLAARMVREIRDTVGWFNLRRYTALDPKTRPAARPRGHDQPAHVAA